MEGLNMAFARSTITNILKKMGANIEQDVIDQAADEIFAAHGSTISSIKSKLKAYDDVDIEELQRDAEELKSLKTKLGKNSIDTLLSTKRALDEQLGERKLEDVLAENAKYAADIQSAKHSKAVDTLLKDLKFTSKAAESFIRSQFDSLELKDDGTLANGAEKLKEVTAANADAFVQGTQAAAINTAQTNLPQFTSTTQQSVAGSLSAEDAFLMQKYGNC